MESNAILRTLARIDSLAVKATFRRNHASGPKDVEDRIERRLRLAVAAYGIRVHERCPKANHAGMPWLHADVNLDNAGDLFVLSGNVFIKRLARIDGEIIPVSIHSEDIAAVRTYPAAYEQVLDDMIRHVEAVALNVTRFVAGLKREAEQERSAG